MNRRILFAALFLCCALTAHAQNVPKLEVSVSTSLDVFLDDFKTAYKPGSTHLLSLARTDRHKKKRRVWGMNLGYANYNPKADTVDYQGDDDFLSHYYYGEYQTLSLSAWGRWDYIINQHFELFFGVEAGYHFTSYDYYYATDGYAGHEGSVDDNRLVLIPQIGIGIPVNRFCFFAQSRYILSVSSGGGVGVDDTFNRILSTGVGVRYRLERPYKKKKEDEPASSKPKITYY